MFDRAGLLDRLAGDEELAQKILGTFLDNMPVRIRDLRTALDPKDASAARMAAHAIKGMAANISAEAMRSLAEKMEKAARSGDLEWIRERMGKLEEKLEELRRMSM